MKLREGTLFPPELRGGRLRGRTEREHRFPRAEPGATIVGRAFARLGSAPHVLKPCNQ
jgi:hypothetical protein